ncbi:MAG: hypothetical protein FWC39_08785 [Bacteroidetes bacterium]|nr:hypothetical protein [Bacteroidota bacterium]
MLKIFFSLFIVILFTGTGCDKQEEKEDYKLVRKFIYPRSTSTEYNTSYEYIYDKYGNMIKEMYYLDKQLHFYIEYEYSKNKKTKEKIFYKSAENFYLNRYTNYSYEGDLLVKEETFSIEYGSDNYSFDYSTTYEYDKRGNLVRKCMYNAAIIGIVTELKYTYDNQNRLILEEIDGYKSTKHVYDDSGRKIKIEYYNINGDLLEYEEKVYNGTNKSPEKDLYYDKNGNLSTTYQHFYDIWGNLTQTSVDGGCTLFERKYDGKLLIEEINYWPEGVEGGCTIRSRLKYEYENLKYVIKK